MRIQFNLINFTASQKTIKNGQNTIVKFYDDNNFLTKTVIYDEFNRDIDSKTYNISGNIKEHLHKEYYEKESEKGFIEIFKNDFQEYTRKSYTKYENNFRHVVDDFKSKTSPNKNYINEFVYDLKNNLVKIINNGKETLLKK